MTRFSLVKKNLPRWQTFFRLSVRSQEATSKEVPENHRFRWGYSSWHASGFSRLVQMKSAENFSERSRPKHILLLDADASVRDSLAAALRSEDYHVVPACDDQEALTELSRHPIDIALVDLAGGTECGWRAVRHLDTADPRLPIILLTAQPDRLTHPLANRAQAWFQKPLLDLPLLLKKLSELTLQNNVTGR